MKEKPGRDSSSVLMDRARQLLDGGHCREAISLALDVLMHELNNLRHALLALEQLVQGEESQTRATQQEDPEPAQCWMPEPKTRILH